MAIRQFQKSDLGDGKPALSISPIDSGTSSATTSKTRIIRTAIGPLALVVGAWQAGRWTGHNDQPIGRCDRGPETLGLGV
jgi:hypothetical protein